VTYAGNADEGFRVLVVFWTPPPQNPAWSMQGQAGSVEYSKEVALPKAVREELGDNGMLIPPKQVTFQSVRFARPPDAGGWELAVSSPQGTSDSVKIVQTFTSSAATSN
jgi:hypothetical protein